MRKYFFILVLVLVNLNTVLSQTRGTKIGYIDMEYILQNVPNYIEANTQLELKAQKWKQEIEVKKINLSKTTEVLNAEKPLLTKGLIEERETEIKFLEKELSDLQQQRFGPNGNFTSQKTDLIKPIQDQVFTAIQDIAEQQKYDFIFDKTSDFTMIFAAKRYDISDLVLRILNRSNKREQLSKKQLQAELEKEKKEDAVDVNPNLVDRQNALEARKAEREKLIEDRKLAAEQKKKDAEDRRAQLLADKEAKISGSNTTKPSATNTDTDKQTAKIKADEERQKQIDTNAKVLEDRKKLVEDRKRELEEKRTKALEEREARKTGTISAPTIVEDVKTEAKKAEATTSKTVETTSPEDARSKALEERKKIIEDRKKELEQKRAKAIQVRDSIKQAREIQLKQ